MNPKLIIGITGTLGAGKGTIVEYLQKKYNFSHFSARDFITKEIVKRDLLINRDSMREVANDLREKNSPSYVAEGLYLQAKEEGKDSVIESLRTLGEIQALKSKGNFYLFAVDAEPQMRYNRILKRSSETDNVSFEKFKENEAQESLNKEAHKQNLPACISQANFIFDNNGSFEDLYKQIDNVIEKIKMESKHEKKEKYQRPSWDEYFLEVMDAVAKRATCDRGRSGCVVARDKQLLVTGYVGSPIGLEHCDEVDHQMKIMVHEDGSATNHCVRTVHAEQNAICQAAKLGVSLDGATLYCKMAPCRVCAMLIINSGIKRVVCQKGYHQGADGLVMFEKAGIEIKVLNPEIEKYANM